jgi:capsular polysaccharide biosynthesis protein
MPNPTILDSLQRFWLVLVLTTLVGAVLGVGYGLITDPKYTAEAQLSVGRIDVQTQSIPGFTGASITLADTYSRAIAADQVITEVAGKTGLSRSEVIDRVSAAPIPETGTVRVFADGDTTEESISTANAAADALVSYVRNLNRFNPDSARLLKQYEDASAELGTAQQDLAQQGRTPDALAAVKRAQLKVNTLGSLYQSSQAGQASPNTLQVLTLAADATSDRTSTLERAGLVGGVVGLLLGALLALVLERRYPLQRV